MTTLLYAPPAISVIAAEETIVAGQSLQATLRFVADRPLQTTGGQVELIRYGAVAHLERGWMGGGGTICFRREAVLDRAELDAAGPLTPGQHLVRRVTLGVPPGEASVAGYLVQQDYAVRARIRLAHARDAEGATALRVTSPASDRSWVTDTGPLVDDADFAVLGFEELSGRRLTEWEPVGGAVTVTPRRAGSARGVRVELILDEHVPARAEEPLEEDRAEARAVATVRLAGQVELTPGRVLRLPFAIRVPRPMAAPSISGPEFTVRWLLRAVLDLPRRPDPTTTVELWGATAP